MTVAPGPSPSEEAAGSPAQAHPHPESSLASPNSALLPWRREDLPIFLFLRRGFAGLISRMAGAAQSADGGPEGTLSSAPRVQFLVGPHPQPSGNLPEAASGCKEHQVSSISHPPASQGPVAQMDNNPGSPASSQGPQNPGAEPKGTPPRQQVRAPSLSPRAS